MNLKEFTEQCLLSHPKLKDLREFFNNSDKSVFVSPQYMELSASEKAKYFAKNLIKVHKVIENQYPTQLQDILPYIQYIAIPGALYLSFQGFYPPIKLLGSDDQISKWEKLVFECRIFGAYAQTEIGHGSDVQSLQTTALFNKEKKCFVLNSPTIKSTKFWPGALGLHATHVVCQAQTYVHEKYYGLQTFVVPIRDTKTYKLFDGIEAGDIGPKLAYSWNDNGYLKFTNYEVPIDNLLRRFIQIDQNGNVKKADDKNAAKIGYGGMLNLRVNLSKYFLLEGFRCVTFGYRNWVKEDHSNLAQKKDLISDFAYSYSNMLALEWITGMYNKFMVNIKTNLKEALKELTELHLIAAGIKSLYSWKVVEQLRKYSVNQSMGSVMVSGVISLYGDTVPAVTYEGDNVVMLQQTAKGLCKYMQHVENEEFQKVPDSLKFLIKLRVLLDKKEEIKLYINNPEELMDLEKLEDLINAISLFAIKENYEQMKELIIKGEPINIVWNEKLQKSMVEMAMNVTEGLTYRMAKKFFLSKDTQKKLKEKDLNILRGILQVYGIDILQKELSLACRFKIGGIAEHLEKIIRKAGQLAFHQIKDNLEYLEKSTLFFEDELYYVRDYRKWETKDDGTDRIKKSLEVQADAMKKYINHFSKL